MKKEIFEESGKAPNYKVLYDPVKDGGKSMGVSVSPVITYKYKKDE